MTRNWTQGTIHIALSGEGLHPGLKKKTKKQKKPLSSFGTTAAWSGGSCQGKNSRASPDSGSDGLHASGLVGTQEGLDVTLRTPWARCLCEMDLVLGIHRRGNVDHMILKVYLSFKVLSL